MLIDRTIVRDPIMPELPEVEAVCRRLRQDACGATIASAHFPRPGIVAPQKPTTLQRKLAGVRIESIRRRGKNILLDLTSGDTLHVHLRMTGNLYVIPDYRFRPATARGWFELEDGRGLIFDDFRALGRIRLHPTAEIDQLLGKIGLEPLDPQFTLPAFKALSAKARQPVKIFLMDQRHVSGIGNIYAAEALFQARIDPRRAASSLSKVRLARLHEAIVSVLTLAVESAVAAYMQPDLFHEGEWFPVQVYGREGEPCNRCGRPVRRIPQGGRSTYYCGGCQK